MLGIGRRESCIEYCFCRTRKNNYTVSINASRDQVSLTKWVYGRNVFGLCFLGGFIGFVIVMVFCFVSSCVVVLVCMLGKFLFWDIPYPVGCTQGIPVFPGIPKQQRLSPPGFGPVSQEV